MLDSPVNAGDLSFSITKLGIKLAGTSLLPMEAGENTSRYGGLIKLEVGET